MKCALPIESEAGNHSEFSADIAIGDETAAVLAVAVAGAVVLVTVVVEVRVLVLV